MNIIQKQINKEIRMIDLFEDYDENANFPIQNGGLKLKKSN